MNPLLDTVARTTTLISAATLLAACGGGGTPAATGADLESNSHVVVASFGPNVVSTWHDVAFATASVPASPSGATPEERVAGPDLTTVHLAMYDAVMAIAGTHEPYAIKPSTPGVGAGAQAMDAAAIEAAYRTLKGLFPSRGDKYEAAYGSSIAAIPDGESKTLGKAIGAEVAAGMLALRANDGRLTVLSPYVPGTGPGQFRNATPVNRIAPYIRPFATNSHSQFRAPPPYALGSAQYATDLNETEAMGGAVSTQRTAAQTEIARFHTEPPEGFWARNLRQFAMASPSLADNARLLAMLSVAFRDSSGGCFESKYQYNFWRPLSAIPLADTDGNPATDLDPQWTPVVPSPNHPEYPAAHGCASGAVMETVRAFYGTKNVSFDFNSAVTATTHHFDRTDDLLKEVKDARVWGGMHFRTSVDAGAELGKDVAKWMTKNHFGPVPGSTPQKP
jgi:hypothetical protein